MQKSDEKGNLPAVTGEVNIFTPSMSIEAAVSGFKEFQKVKEQLLDESDIVVFSIYNKKLAKNEERPFVKKSGWNKLACFFGASTRTVKAEKIQNEDGSYEWKVTVEAYKVLPNGEEVYKVQRSAIVSSLEKEQTKNMAESPRKSHDVFSSAETRAEGRALSAYFGSGELSAEEIEGSPDFKKVEDKFDKLCTCFSTARKTDPQNPHKCTNCGGKIS